MCTCYRTAVDRLALRRRGGGLAVSALVILTVAATSLMNYAQALEQTASESVRYTLYGTSIFPFARSDDAVEKTVRVAGELSDLYVVQLDDGVPWAEALEDKEFPAATKRKWGNLLAHAPAGKPLYLALEPLASDRVTLAPPSEGSSLPAALHDPAYDAEAMRRAYLNYARRAARFFNPTFLNLGVENGELAHRDPGRWPAYVRLIRSVMESLHSEFPGLKQGISFGLQSLMEPATAKRAQDLVEASDYLGLSFYPYMSSFHEKFHLRPLPPPPQEWRAPLNWLRTYTNKPIAICETGYNTKNVQLPELDIRLLGDAQLQAAYVRDLVDYAARYRYLFVVYYLPVDIAPLLSTLSKSERSAASMWGENGMFDANLQPKPVVEAWRRAVAQRYEPPPSLVDAGASRTGATAGRAPSSSSEERSQKAAMLFSRAEDLCQSPPPGHTQIEGAGTAEQAMRWRYQQRQGSWAWCSRKFQSGSFPRGNGMSLRIRSDRDVQLILQLKESNGTAHYSAISAGPAWRDVALEWSDFRLDEHTGSDRRVHPESVVEVVLADEGKGASSPGQQRDVWMSQWQVR